MVEIGYSMSSEEHAPLDLVQYAKIAEDVGFSFALISDHYPPWISRQGHSLFVWSVIGAIATATDRLRGGTGHLLVDADAPRHRRAGSGHRGRGLPGDLSQELPRPRHFEQACQLVDENTVTRQVVCSSDVAPHLEAISSSWTPDTTTSTFTRSVPTRKGSCRSSSDGPPGGPGNEGGTEPVEGTNSADTSRRGSRRSRVPDAGALARGVLRLRRDMLQVESNGAVQRPVPSVTESLDRMVDAAQKVVGDEVSLFRADVTSATTHALQGGAMLLLATAMLAIGWVIALMAAFQVLASRVGALETLVGLAVLNLLAGVLLLMGARRRLKEVRNG
jgi:Putative Actinobacterial Holin-X, holin superfamily III/Luciferase-like monooxygenase